MRSSLPWCQQYCPKQQGQRSQIITMARWLVWISGSTTSFVMGLAVPAVNGIPLEPVNSPLSQLEAISPYETGKETKSIAVDLQNTTDIQTKQNSLQLKEKFTAAHLPVEVTSKFLEGVRSPLSIFPVCPPAHLFPCGDNNFDMGANSINPPSTLR